MKVNKKALVPASRADTFVRSKHLWRTTVCNLTTRQRSGDDSNENDHVSHSRSFNLKAFCLAAGTGSFPPGCRLCYKNIF